jgi:peroxiredoxin Q/BCP
MGLEEGKRFVDFNLKNQDGETVSLDDFKGKWLVVYVYPKDDTPGCTIQGKSFTATKQEFEDANISVVGVSAINLVSLSICSRIRITSCCKLRVWARVNTRERCTGTAPVL